MVVVGTAIDGDETIRMVLEFKPHLVLLDIDMPNQNGQTACTAIKNAIPGTKVYFCSAHSDNSLTQIAQNSRADGIVRKSDLNEDLQKIISEDS